MKERPILFSSNMINALLIGQKTQTRRVVRNPEDGDNIHLNYHSVGMDGYGDWIFWSGHDFPVERTPEFYPDGGGIKCPYGKSSDELWVKESFWDFGGWVKDGDKKCWKASGFYEYGEKEPDKSLICEEYLYNGWFWRRRPSIHMPRWASRIQLVIKNIRVERVQDISIDDIYAEGAYSKEWGRMPGSEHKAFKALWDSINAKRGYGWETNPWVWVIEFEVKK